MNDIRDKELEHATKMLPKVAVEMVPGKKYLMVVRPRPEAPYADEETRTLAQNALAFNEYFKSQGLDITLLVAGNWPVDFYEVDPIHGQGNTTTNDSNKP